MKVIKQGDNLIIEPKHSDKVYLIRNDKMHRYEIVGAKWGQIKAFPYRVANSRELAIAYAFQVALDSNLIE